MKKLLIGFILGLIIGAGIVYADSWITLQNARGTEIGTTASPIYIKLQ